jgi:RNA polymerase sigma factor (sigma-70 family)
VQEALIELAGQPRVPESPVAWLYRVVRNRAISQLRSARRRQRREELAFQFRAEGTSASGGREPPEAFDLTTAELAAAIESLPDEIREVVVARTWGKLNFEQIAELVGCSTSTAHRRYEAGLAALRERLDVACQANTNRRG